MTAFSARARTLALRFGPVLAVTLVGWLLRLVHIGFSGGLPRGRPDEELFAVAALKMFSGDTNPHFAHYGWPELYFRLVHLAQGLYGTFAKIAYGAEVNLGCLYVLDPGRITVLGRIVSATFGAATIPFVAGMARELVDDAAPPAAKRWIGPLAGLFFAFNYLHARDSHFAVTDAPVVFFIAAASWALLAAAHGRGDRLFVLAGVLLGLGISTKYSAVGFLPACLLALVWRIAVGRGARLRIAGLGVLAILAGAAAFIAASPHFVEEPHQFYEGVFAHTVRFSADSSGWGYDPAAVRDKGLIHHFRISFPLAMGAPQFILSLIGVGLSFARPRGARLVLALSTVAFYVFLLGPSTLVILRYTLPLAPALTALAALPVFYTLAAVERGAADARVTAAAAIAIGCVLVLPPATRLREFLRLAGSDDTREVAAHYLLDHAHENDTVVALGDFASIHAVERDKINACTSALPEGLRARVPTHIGGDSDFERLVRKGERGWGRVAEAALTRNGGGREQAEWLVTGTPLLACGRFGTAPGSETPDPRCFRARAVFSPGHPTCDARYDTLDSFFIPFDGFAGIDHIGPEVHVYENLCRRR